MNAAPFSHMLWKEYRTLRMLWVGCALGTIGLWGMLYLGSVIAGARTADDQVHLLHACWSLSLWLPAIYLLGCTVATFAGEREERTADWLINLSVPYASTVAAKLIWPVASAATMQLLLFGATALIRQYFLSVTNIGMLPGDESLPEMPALASFALVEALVWGLFWSLQLSKPMPAAVVAAVCVVAVNMGTLGSRASAWEKWLEPWSPLRVLLVIALLAADLALARRWLLGRGWEWSLPWNRFIGRRAAKVAAPAIEHATPWRRAWQRLRWLEWQTIRVFLICATVAAIVAAIPVMIWGGNGIGLVLIAAFFLPLVAGLAAWQGEHARFQFRFLANRGVSPYGLWLNKFGLWLLTLVASVALFAVFALIALVLGEATGRLRGMAPLIHHAEVMWNQMMTHLPYVLAFVAAYFSLFVSSFTVGLFFRRGIFAFGAAWVLQAVICYWSVGSFYLNIPGWLGIVPVGAWLLWCGLRQLPRWYLERTGWRVNSLIAAEWLIFPMIFMSAMTAYWVYSIPNPNVEQLMLAGTQPLGAGFATTADTEWADVRRKAAQLAMRAEGRPISDGGPLDRLSDAQWSPLEADVRSLREALLKPLVMTRSTRFFEQSLRDGMFGIRTTIVVNLLIQQAERDLAAGREDDSILGVRAAVRYAGALYTDAPLDYRIHESHNWLHQDLLAWVEHPQNTPELVRRTLAELERQELRWWITDPIAIHSQYWRSLVELERTAQTMRTRGWLLEPWLVHERRLAACEFSNQLRYLRTLPPQRGYGSLPPGLTFGDEDAAWKVRGDSAMPQRPSQTAPGVPVGLTAQIINSLWERETRIRGTFAAMAAVAYRRAHDRLPRTLADVVPQIASRELLSDPWSGMPLQFEPDGKPGPVVSSHQYNARQIIAARTPFVWSVGPGADRIVESPLQPLKNHVAWQFAATRFYPLYQIQAMPYAFTLPTPGEPADALKPVGFDHPDRAGFGGPAGSMFSRDAFGAGMGGQEPKPAASTLRLPAAEEE